MSSWLKKKSNALELYTIDVILGRRADTGAAIYGAFLQLLSYLFSGIAQLRFWLYRHRILHDQPLGCLVVVVGNLTVGGTGKTPVVEKFARALHDRGRKVAILSRGYKSKAPPVWKKWWWSLTHSEEPPPRIVSDGKNVLLNSEESGDEPFMLAKNLPGVIVLVDKNRVKAGAYAIKEFGCDTLVLDDGFQYLPLKGQLNLLLVDKTNPFGNGHLLPRGILREPIKHLKRASYVLLTKSNGERDHELEALIQKHNPGVDAIECAHEPKYLQRFGSDERQALDFLKNRRVVADSLLLPEILLTTESGQPYSRSFYPAVIFLIVATIWIAVLLLPKQSRKRWLSRQQTIPGPFFIRLAIRLIPWLGFGVILSSLFFH